jgi:hypothetical protein
MLNYGLRLDFESNSQFPFKARLFGRYLGITKDLDIIN